MQSKTNERNQWLANLKVQDTVWWSDPDHGKASGYYRVIGIADDERLTDASEDLIILANEAGSVAEVLAIEIHPTQPEGLFPVVDGASGAVDVYGYATNVEDAIAVGNEFFADEVVDAYLAEDVQLCDGSTVPKAWVALTAALEQPVTVKVVIEATYHPSGLNIDAMVSDLTARIGAAVGGGLLTGDSSVIVDRWDVKAKIVPDQITEDELTTFMANRIDEQDLLPEDIPRRLARYGLMEPETFINEMRERMHQAG